MSQNHTVLAEDIPALDIPALSVRGLVRRYGDFAAVDHVDLTVQPGSFYGLVGPNGAGKSTTIACSVGLEKPDAGTSVIAGHDAWGDPLNARRQMGVLPDDLALPEQLSGGELLGYLGQLHGLPAQHVANRADELLQLLELDGKTARTLVMNYSTGMRKKIGLAIALIHRPRLLILDEPFEAVDPISALTIRHILNRFVAGGGAVLMSSHSMALVEQLCDTVSIMAAGKVAVEGSLDDVRGTGSLEEAFVRWVGVELGTTEDGLSWLA